MFRFLVSQIVGDGAEANGGGFLYKPKSDCVFLSFNYTWLVNLQQRWVYLTASRWVSDCVKTKDLFYFG